jgi:hypothetical protein
MSRGHNFCLGGLGGSPLDPLTLLFDNENEKLIALIGL